MKWAKPKNLFIEEKWYRGNEVFWQIQFNIYSWWGKGVSENLNHLWNLFIRLSHIKLHLLNYSWPIKMTVIWFNWQLWGYSITPPDNSLGLHFMTSPKFKRFEILSTSICLSIYIRMYVVSNYCWPTSWAPQSSQVDTGDNDPPRPFLSPEISPLNGQPHPLRDRHWSCLNQKVWGCKKALDFL